MIDITSESYSSNDPVVNQLEFNLDQMQTVTTNQDVDRIYKNSNSNSMPAAVFVQNGSEYQVPAVDITMNYNQSKGVKREKVKWQIFPVAVYLKNPMNKNIIPKATLTANIRKGIDQKSTTMSSAGADIALGIYEASVSLGVTIGTTTDMTNYGYESETNANITMSEELNYYFYQTSVLFCFRCPYGAGYKNTYTHGLDGGIIAESNPGVYRVVYGLTSYDDWFFVSVDRNDFFVNTMDNLYSVKTHNEMVDYFMNNQSLLFKSIQRPVPTN
ncbi:hypothetical protein ACTFIR_009458 [Dictyostelium discoideum]